MSHRPYSDGTRAYHEDAARCPGTTPWIPALRTAGEDFMAGYLDAWHDANPGARLPRTLGLPAMPAGVPFQLH